MERDVYPKGGIASTMAKSNRNHHEIHNIGYPNDLGKRIPHHRYESYVMEEEGQCSIFHIQGIRKGCRGFLQR